MTCHVRHIVKAHRLAYTLYMIFLVLNFCLQVSHPPFLTDCSVVLAPHASMETCENRKTELLASPDYFLFSDEKSKNGAMTYVAEPYCTSISDFKKHFNPE